MDGVHDLHHRQAAGGVQIGCLPEFFEERLVVGVIDPFVVGIHHGDESDIGGPLDIVLAPQGMQTGPGSANLAGQQGQGNQATCIVGAVDVLGDAHAPDDHRSFGAGIDARNFLQGFSRDAAHGRYLLRGEFRDLLLQRFIALGALCDEVIILQSFLDDGMHQCIEHGHIGIGAELQEITGVARQFRLIRIQHDQGLTGARGIFHEGGGDRVINRGFSADDDNDFRLGDVGDGIGYRAGADGLQQGGHG